MAATDSRVLFLFTQQDQRFAESLALKGITSLSTARTNAIKLAQARLGLAGHGVKLVGIRISLIGDPGQVESVLPSEHEWTNPASTAVGDDGPESERSTEVVLHSCVGEEGRRKKIFMAGCPDRLFSETGTDGLRLDRVQGWEQSWNYWRSLMLKGSAVSGAAPWGFVVRPAKTDASANAILAGQPDGVTGEVVLTIGGDVSAKYKQGTPVIISGNRRVLAGYRGINGRQMTNNAVYVPASTTTLVRLAGTANVDTSKWLIGSYGVIRPEAFHVVQFTEIKRARAGERRRGTGGFTRERGRARTRKLLP